MTDANSNTTRYEYNELNWLTKETNSLGLATTYAYDLAGNRSGATSPRGVQTSYQYYPNNLLKDVTYSLGDMMPTDTTISAFYSKRGPAYGSSQETGSTSN